MSRLHTEYASSQEAANAPCVICRMPHREHTRTAALMCFRQILRHPEADADDVLVLLGGALHTIARTVDLPGSNLAIELQRQIEILAHEVTAAYQHRKEAGR